MIGRGHLETLWISKNMKFAKRKRLTSTEDDTQKTILKIQEIRHIMREGKVNERYIRQE